MLISNSSISSKVNLVIETLRKYPVIIPILHTSLDCGTKLTYMKLKNRDLFDNTVSNILKYAQSGVFHEMTLKYVFTEDGINSSDEDILGFTKILHEVSSCNKQKTSVIIDADMTVQKTDTDDYMEASANFHYVPLSEQMVEAAGKLYYFLHKFVPNAEIKFIGGRINPERSIIGKADMEKIIDFAYNYKNDKNIISIY